MVNRTGAGVDSWDLNPDSTISKLVALGMLLNLSVTSIFSSVKS